MDEYIERKKLYNDLVLLAKYEMGERQQGILGCAETVRIFSAADVAPVVRCRDCKYYRVSTMLAPNKFCFRLKHPVEDRPIGYNFAPDDFCSYGERKEND